jgi:hypothetical protein
MQALSRCCDKKIGFSANFSRVLHASCQSYPTYTTTCPKYFKNRWKPEYLADHGARFSLVLKDQAFPLVMVKNFIVRHQLSLTPRERYAIVVSLISWWMFLYRVPNFCLNFLAKLSYIRRGFNPIK